MYQVDQIGFFEVIHSKTRENLAHSLMENSCEKHWHSIAYLSINMRKFLKGHVFLKASEVEVADDRDNFCLNCYNHIKLSMSKFILLEFLRVTSEPL